jgi:putative membrane protein
MLSRTRLAPALVAGAFALAACGGGNSGADSAAAVATTDSAAGMTAGTGDSAAHGMGGAGGAGAAGNLSPANIASLVSLSNASEIGQGEVARDKATNADVKSFARMMVTEHQAMQKSLDSLSQAKSVTPQPPAQADQLRQQDTQTLATLNSTAKGAAFDRAYIAAQVQAHQRTLTDLQSFVGAVSDADMRALIEKSIPKVQAHLDQAQQLQSKLGGA